MEMALRLGENIHAPYYALTLVGPAAMAIEIWRSERSTTPACVGNPAGVSFAKPVADETGENT
jgi:hypothetical protein